MEDQVLLETIQVGFKQPDSFLMKYSFTFFSDAERGSQAGQAVVTIQQKMTDFLKKEEKKVEENIQRYTEQQQAALLTLETRVRQDRNTLLM